MNVVHRYLRYVSIGYYDAQYRPSTTLHVSMPKVCGGNGTHAVRLQGHDEECCRETKGGGWVAGMSRGGIDSLDFRVGERGETWYSCSLR